MHDQAETVNIFHLDRKRFIDMIRQKGGSESTGVLLSIPETTESKEYPTVLGRKIDAFRLEAGLSFDELSEETAISKTLIIGHVNHGKQPQPRNLRLYATTFTRLLGRDITVAELRGKTAPK